RPRQRAATGGPGGIGGAQGAQRPSTARAPRRLCSFAAGADAHYADRGETELSGEGAIGPAGIAEPTNLLVPLGFDATRQTAGEDRGLRDTDPEGLCHLAQRASVADHAGDIVLGGILPAEPWSEDRLGHARDRREVRRVVEQLPTD